MKQGDAQARPPSCRSVGSVLLSCEFGPVVSPEGVVVSRRDTIPSSLEATGSVFPTAHERQLPVARVEFPFLQPLVTLLGDRFLVPGGTVGEGGGAVCSYLEDPQVGSTHATNLPLPAPCAIHLRAGGRNFRPRLGPARDFFHLLRERAGGDHREYRDDQTLGRFHGKSPLYHRWLDPVSTRTSCRTGLKTLYHII